MEIPPNVVFFLADGKVHGNELKLTKGLVDENGKAIAKTKRKLYMFTSEASEAEWRGKMQGVSDAVVYFSFRSFIIAAPNPHQDGKVQTLLEKMGVLLVL